MPATADRLAIHTLRGLAMDGVQAANSGHPGTPMALAPMGYVLWTKFLRHNPKNPAWLDRDRFVLSCGHASMLLYGLLHLTGYDLPLEELKAFRQWGSKTPGHPEFGHTVGVETTTGPLGQGLGNALGMAMAEKFLAEHFNRAGHEIVNHRTYAIVSDGDVMEGVGQEAASLAGHLGLEKLICLYDDNHITIEGDTDLAFSDDVGKRFEACGWRVLKVLTGEDLNGLESALHEATHEPCGRPTLIITRTIIGFPAPNKQNHQDAHGAPLGQEEIAATKAVMGLDPEATFAISDAARASWNICLERGELFESEWVARFEAFREAHPALADEYVRWMKGDLTEGWEAHLPVFAAGGKMATRDASGKVINALAQGIPNFLGGSADLGSSNKTVIKDARDYSRHEAGRNLHFGVREHAMGAALNGMSLHGGVRTFGATFLIFSDYMRPSVRLAALMKQPVCYVWTHDSIGVGEDGPTHQPIEQTMSLRMIPGLHMWRPADANETAVAWKCAMQRKDGPSAFALTRQNLPVLDAGKTAGAARGGYILEDGSAAPKVLLLATGSEVPVALEARASLESQGVPTRVVSLPCWEVFNAQDAAYRDSVIPPTIKARVSIEAGVTFGWQRFTGDDGAVIGLDHFGASAPAETLFEKFGITAENVVKVAKGLL
ncbi:MAG: transketolase [Acidobacteriota bacterium]|nr:transketolase [Acidobacteriota bacterium]